MGKFDHLNKLQVEAELRRLEVIPPQFRGSDFQELRDRLAKILEEEKQAEIDRDERKHGETISAARRSRIASFLSVAAAIVSAAAAVVSAFYSCSDHSQHAVAPTTQPNTSPATTSSPTASPVTH